MKEFILKGINSISLVDLLKESGVCSTNDEARKKIFSGEIKINGVVEKSKKRQLQSGDVVECDGQMIRVKAEHFFL